METAYIFYKKIPIDKNSVFTANIAEENEVEDVRFKKSKEYAVNGLSFSQDLDSSLDSVTDTGRQEALSNLKQKIIKEKNEPDLDFRI